MHNRSDRWALHGRYVRLRRSASRQACRTVVTTSEIPRRSGESGDVIRPCLRHVGSVSIERHERGFYSLRWILIHLIEEYARHLGHTDLIREAIDGQTGE